MRKKRFFFHYNKPMAQRLGRPQVSVHFNRQCIIVDNIECTVPTEGKINKRQPYFVMQGFASDVRIENNKAIIV